MACSYEEVQDRIARRGTHIAPFSNDPNAGKIADAVRQALYALDQEDEWFFGMHRPEFSDLVYTKHLLWAPDGDEAFDDGSYVLQFDIDDRVRLIAFKHDDAYQHDPTTLRDVWLVADDFYRILQDWGNTFIAEWMSLPKS